MMADGKPVDGSWELSIAITDQGMEKTLRVKGDLHIGGVMLRLVDDLGKPTTFTLLFSDSSSCLRLSWLAALPHNQLSGLAGPSPDNRGRLYPSLESEHGALWSQQLAGEAPSGSPWGDSCTLSVCIPVCVDFTWSI